MATAKSPTCVGCGAPLGPWDAAGYVRCGFCQRDNYIQQRPQTRIPFQPSPVGVHPNVGAGLGVGVIVAISLTLTIGGVVAGLVSWGTSSVASGFGADGSGPGSGGVVPSGEHMQWGGGEGNLTPVNLDDDGVEDFVGVYRVLDMGASEQYMYVGGFDGKSLERKWKSAALGTLGDNGYTIRSAVAGRRVVVTDTKYVAHILELSTGKEVGAIKLTDRPNRMCSEGAGGDHVWIEVADHKNVLIDAKAAQGKAAPEPAFCVAKEGYGCESSRAECLDGDTAPKLDGFLARTVLREGKATVAVGMKSPGTPVPMLAGFDAASKKVKWSGNLPSEGLSSTDTDPPIDLVNGRFYAAYELTGSKGSNLVAIDAETGKRLWESPIPRSESGSGPDEIVVTKTRIYVPHWTWLDIFDASNGKGIGTVGIW